MDLVELRNKYPELKGKIAITVAWACELITTEKRVGAVEELNWVLSKRVPKPLKAITTNNEEVILIYVKDVEKRLGELR